MIIFIYIIYYDPLQLQFTESLLLHVICIGWPDKASDLTSSDSSINFLLSFRKYQAINCRIFNCSSMCPLLLSSFSLQCWTAIRFNLGIIAWHWRMWPWDSGNSLQEEQRLSDEILGKFIFKSAVWLLSLKSNCISVLENLPSTR